MQTAGGALETAAEAVILASERRFVAEILVDWDKDGSYDHVMSDLTPYYSDVSVDRALRGGAPEELMLIEGSAAAELELVMSGDLNGLNLVSVFSPYNGFSPLYTNSPIGSEIVYRIGVPTALGTAWYQQFIGFVRLITPNRAENTVTITAIDRSEVLRGPIQFPPYAIGLVPWEIEGYHNEQLISTQWVIDHCLRVNNTSPSPKRPTQRYDLAEYSQDNWGVQLWVSGTASFLPTIGWMDNTRVQAWTHNDGSLHRHDYVRSGQVHPDSPEPETPPWCFGHQNTSFRKYWCKDRDKIFSPATHYAGFTIVANAIDWVHSGARTLMDINIGDNRRIVINADSTGYGDTGRVALYSRYIRSNGSYYSSSVFSFDPEDDDFVDVEVMWDGSEPTGLGVYFQVNSSEQTFTHLYNIVDEPELDELKGLVIIDHYYPLQDIYWAAYPIIGGLGNMADAWRPAEYAAVLDRGVNRFSFLPVRNNEDGWAVVTEVAAAEFGSVFWDEQGVFHFWEYTRMIDKQSEPRVRNFSLNHVEGLEITDTLDSVRNIWAVEASRKYADDDTIYSSDNVNEFVVPPVSVKNFRVYVDDMLCPDPGLIPRYESNPEGTGYPQWNDDRKSGYCLQKLVSGNWVDFDAAFEVEITCFIDHEGFLIVKVYNGSISTIRFATFNGEQPALRIRGTKIYGGDVQQTELIEDGGSISKYGKRTLSLTGQWYQEHFNFENMVTDLLNRTSNPIPTTEEVVIAGDPRLQLGDCIDVQDSKGLGETLSLQIYGITRTLSRDTGLTDTLTVEMLRPPGIGIWDSPQYGRWDETFVWSD